MHKAETGSYVRFPANIPIPADLRIGRVTISCGLIEVPPGKRVDDAMESIDQVLNREKRRILSAWARISEEAGGLSLFRIDSLVWQVGEPIFKHRRDPATARVTVSKILESYSCPADISCLVGGALCRL
jgi:N-glycosylase/DNA lyase